MGKVREKARRIWEELSSPSQSANPSRASVLPQAGVEENASTTATTPTTQFPQTVPESAGKAENEEIGTKDTSNTGASSPVNMRKVWEKTCRHWEKLSSPSQSQSASSLAIANPSRASVLPQVGVEDNASTTATTPTTQFPQTVPESAGKAENEEIGAKDTSNTAASSPVPPGAGNGADKPRISPTAPTQQLHGTPLADEVANEENIPLITPAMNDTKIQSLWNKAANDPRLSSQQRQKLAEVGIAPSSEITSALGEMMAGILKEKEEKMWKIEFRGDEIVLGHVGKKILHWLDRFKEIGDIIIQFDPVHAALPWAGFRFLLKLCLDKQGTVDAILIGLEKMASLIDRSTIYILLYLHTNTTASQNLERSILGLFTAILKFVTIAIHRLNDNHLQAVFTTEKISDELREVEELEQTVGHDAAMAEAESASTRFDRLQKLLQGVATRKGCERLQQMLNDVTMTMLNLGPQIDAIEKSLEVNRKSKILQWISNIPYTEHHARISEGRLKGTGDWLFEREEYRNWRAISASKLLLLRGIPGAGKTYIASRIIDSFREMPEGKLAYFYCNRAEENRREPRKILSTLIQQLAQTASKEGSKEGLLMPIVDIYRDRERNGQKSAQLSLKESQDLLVQLIDIYPQTTICIDAMDEVDHDTRIHLLKSLKNVIKASKNVVKIFVTTRMDSDILMQFEIFPRIELEPDDNEDDINAFLRTQVQSLIDDGLLLHGEVSKELKEEIYNSLCQRCKGKL